MRGRSRAGGEPAKPQRRKTAARKSRIAPKAVRPRRSSAGREKTKVAQLTRELKEAFRQQTATADVLKAISRSTFDLTKVLNALLESAARLSEADKGAILRPTGRDASYYVAASYRHTAEFDEYLKNLTFAPGRSGVVGRVLLDGKSIQIPDVLADPEFNFREIASLGDFRTQLGVPLQREGTTIGVVLLQRAAVRPFTDKQIKLVETFADQAVIAIENTRLFEAEQQRTRELSESLEQQTATAQVLEVISRSPGDLQPVFETMLENAIRICDAKFGNIYRWDGEALHLLAAHNVPIAFADVRRRLPLQPDNPLIGRMLATRAAVQIPDVAALPSYLDRNDAAAVAAVELGRVRTILAVPMLKENELIGSFTLYRQEIRPFTDKQIDLVQNFAAQAVIAIENARLLNDLRESLQQQTATADVLKIISRSTFDLQAVFVTLVESATRLCRADKATITWLKEHQLPVVATYGFSDEFAEYIRTRAPRLDRSSVAGRCLLEGRPVQVPDVMNDPEFQLKEAATIGGFRTALGVPLMRQNAPIGVLFVARDKIEPFTQQQIDLITTFADQAVIAIENTRLFEAEQQRTRELSESLEQQTATSEVLQVISSSPGDLQSVFAAMLENAVRICDATFGNIYRWEDDALHLVAAHNTPPAWIEARRRSPLRAAQNPDIGRMIAAKTTLHVTDAATLPGYIDRSDPASVGAVELGGIRSALAVPMLRENELIGSFTVYRQEVRPFTDKQIELIENFAAQAVIAIENARLLNELRQRTDDLSERTADLTEALGQQTATSEVLQVISRSPGDLVPVFQVMLENATRICEAKFGVVFSFDGNEFHVEAQVGAPPEFADYLNRARPLPQPLPGSHLDRLRQTKRVSYTADYAAEGIPAPPVTLGGARSTVDVPMLKDNELVGAFSIYRQEVRPFTEKQIDLVKNFAAQAVIAIENVRLLNELRQSLERQTATSRVLQVISSSPGDLEPVFRTMLENATRICEAKFGVMQVPEGDGLRAVAFHDVPLAYAEVMRRDPVFRPNVGHPLDRVARSKQVVHIPDARTEDGLRGWIVELAGARTLLLVPMLKDDRFVGVISIYRQEVRRFTDKQIELVKSFAAQAVIAIENARLLNELRQRTDDLGRSVDELRALGEVSQAVNSTLDLENVLSTIVAKAAQLSDTEAGAIYVFDEFEREFRLRATYGMDQGLIDALRQQHIGMDEPNVERAFAEGEPIQVADLREDASSPANEIVLRAGYRARLVAPLMRGEDIVGMLVVRRRAPGAFPQNIVGLIKTFAAQSAVAIENARLFANVETRTGELAKSLEDLRTAQDRLVQTEKLASLGQLTAGIAHEIKNPLNFVNNFSGVSVELIDELQQALEAPHLDKKARAEITELANTLRSNLDKVVQHGKRADAIVKNMLLHSRQGSGEHRPVDINALVEESLNLAYHGARAEKQGFNITLERTFDPAAGEVDLFPQEITRALLNLISNGFYAATKRKGEANGGNYEPTLAVTTKNLGNSIEIRIRDNGTGIPLEVKEKLFSPFFTTKPAGEGTGLGLSISHDIIVKQHGGSIDVDTQPGEFTEFRIVLPRAGTALIKSGERI